MINYPINTPDRVDFNEFDFNTLVWQKGREVILEKSLECPCKGRGSNQQSNCKNCGGTGYVFINPYKTRMVIQSMNRTMEYKPWTEANSGMINITALETEELSFMDRITMLDGESTFQEVLSIKSKGNKLFAYTAYPVKDMKYCGLFLGTDQPIQKLKLGPDFLIDEDIFILDNKFTQTNPPLSVTVRYIHAPTYLVLDMKRDSIESFEYNFGEKLLRLPVSAMAKRAHYNLKKENLLGDRLINNSFTEACVSYDERNRIFTQQFNQQFQ
jgi:hypothetical protein